MKLQFKLQSYCQERKRLLAVCFFAAGNSSVHFSSFCDPIGDDEISIKAPELACCWASSVIQSKPKFLHNCKICEKLK